MHTQGRKLYGHLIQRVFVLVLVFAFIAGCAPQPAATTAPTDPPAATNTTAPTDTPVPPTDTPVPPTDTPEPTATETLVPTDTPDLEATRAVEATAAAEALLAPIQAKLEDVGVSSGTGSLAWIQGEPYPFTVDTPGTFYIDSMVGAPSAANFVLNTDVKWETETGLVICGLVFRSDDDIVNGEQYQFLFLRFSGLPGWDIEFHEDGYYKNTITGEVKYSDAMKMESGATNNILLIADNEKFTVYINGVRQGSFYDYSKQSLDGVFGFTAYEEGGESTCTYSNTWIWQLP
jgi:hypothetical protein